MIEVKNVNNEIIVIAPYNENFVKRAHKLNGKYNLANKAWAFDLLTEESVRKAVLDIYGFDANNSETVNIKITAKEDLFFLCRSAVFNGIPVARAYDRDSGAKMESGAMLLKGNVSSGGSIKNWGTVVSDGTEIILKNVPKSCADNYKGESWKVEVLQETDKKSKLLKEKELLLKRLAEIEEELKK